MSRYLALLPALSLSAGGCVSYAQTAIGELEPNDRVRVEIEDTEVARLLQFVDDRSQTVSGSFVWASADSVAVVVRTPAAYSQVTIPRGAILALERGQTSATKNIIGSAVILGGIATAAVLGFEGGGEESIDLGGGTDEFRARAVLFSVPLRLLFGG